MKTTISNIVNDCKIVIDEITDNSNEFLTETDSQNLNTIIKSKIAEAYNYCHLSADISLMEGDCTYVDSQELTSNYDSKNVQVDNMLRFLYAANSSWKIKQVCELTMPGTPEFDRAFDSYVGATNDRPVALYVFNAVHRFVQLVPAPSGRMLVCYIKRYVAPETDTTEFDIDTALYHPFINYLSALVLMQQNDNRGENLLTLARNEMCINPNNNE